MEPICTTPIGMPNNVVSTIPIKIAPRTFLTTKIVVMTKPITANKIGALLKFAKAGTIPLLIETLVALPPSTTLLVMAAESALNESKPAFFYSNISNKDPNPTANGMLHTFNGMNDQLSNFSDSNQNVNNSTNKYHS